MASLLVAAPAAAGWVVGAAGAVVGAAGATVAAAGAAVGFAGAAVGGAAGGVVGAGAGALVGAGGAAGAHAADNHVAPLNAMPSTICLRLKWPRRRLSISSWAFWSCMRLLRLSVKNVTRSL